MRTTLLTPVKSSLQGFHPWFSLYQKLLPQQQLTARWLVETQKGLVIIH